MRMPSTAAGDAAPARGQPAPAPGRLARLRTGARGIPALARRHWLFTVLLTAGLVLRVLAEIAYRPALIYIDSTKYLLGAYPGDDPPGYQMAIKPLLALGNLDEITAIQHLLGLVMAVTIYLVLLRRGAPRWLSALATAPILLDAYQVQIEQNIMPDVMFETLIVAGLAALLWYRTPTPWMVAIAGFALGASATAQQVGEIFIVPAVGFLLIVVPGWRTRLKYAGLLCALFALPIVVASYKNYVSPKPHSFGLAPYASGTIYGRLAYAADCNTLKLPYYERELCPNAQQRALGPDQLDHGPSSPIKGYTATGLSAFDHQVLNRSTTVIGQICHTTPPASPTLCGQVTSDFDHRVLTQQPLRVVGSIARDTLKMFALTRVTDPGDVPISRWQFQTYYAQYPPYVVIQNGAFVFGTYNHQGIEQTIGTGRDFAGGNPVVVRPLAEFLRAYQLDGGYTPGPLFLFAVLAGLAGSLATLRRRAPAAQRAAALGCLLFYVTGVMVLLASDVFEFNWRYQLPALITLPPAAALAITIVLHRRATSPVAASPVAASPVAAGGEVIPDPLEAGHGRHDDHPEGDEHHRGQPGGSGPHQDGRHDRPDDDGGQHAEAALHPVRFAAGHQPGDETGEGAGQVGT
jgi:dolichyl-phosphate-mannose-protein mannosyltransferase